MNGLHVEGLIRFHLLSWDLDEETLRRELRKMSLKDKERHASDITECRNLICVAGRTYLLTMLATNPFQSPSQYFGIGTGPIVAVSAGDTSIPTEIFRALNNGTSVTTNALANSATVDINFALTTGQANGSWTSVGLWGQNAVSTPGGAGTLETHAVTTQVKTSANTMSIDYLATFT